MSEILYKLGFEKGFLTQNPRIIKASHDKFKYFKKKNPLWQRHKQNQKPNDKVA